MLRSFSLAYSEKFKHIYINYLPSILYWLLLILPLPIYFKIISIILTLIIADIEFVYLLSIIAGLFKIWGPIAKVNNVIDLTMLSSIILLFRISLDIMKNKLFFIDKYSKYLIMGVLLFIIGMLISLFYTLDGTNGINKVSIFFFITIPILFTPMVKSFINKGRKFIIKFIIYLIIHGTFFSFMAVITNSRTVLNADYIGLGRLSGCVALVFLIYIISSKSKNKLLPGIYFILMVLNIFALILSTGRGPAISFIVTPILFINLLKGKYYFIERYLILVLIVAILVFLAWKESHIYLGFYYRIIQGLGEGNLFNRAAIFETSFKMFKEKPIGGYGIGSYYAYLTGITGWNLYSHNIILEIMAELGMVGLISFSLLFSLIALKVRYLLTRVNTPIVNVLVSLFIYFFLNSLFAGDINSNKFLWCFIGLIFSYKIKGYKNG